MTFQLQGNAPEIYEKVMVPLWFGRWAAALIDLVELRPGERVLDIACGTGVTTRLAKDCVGAAGKVDGLDINLPMLEKATQLAGERDIDWIHSDVCEIASPSESFDVIISQHGYHYFSEKPKALAEFKRLLVPGGRIAFSIWDGHSPYTEALCAAVERYISPEIASKQRSQRSTPTADELYLQAENAGFSDIKIERQQLEVDVPLPEEFVPLHLGSMPIAAAFEGLSESIKQELIADVAMSLAPFIREGRLRYPDAVHVVVGYK